MAKESKKDKKKSQKEINRENLQAGRQMINRHPIFGHICTFTSLGTKQTLGTNTYCIVRSDGEIVINEDAALSPGQWAYVIAHSMLHLAFGHFDADNMPGYYITDEYGNKSKKVECDPLLWNMACDIYVNKFLADIKFGQSIHNSSLQSKYANYNDELKIFEALLEDGLSGSANVLGTSTIGTCDMKGLENPIQYGEGEYNYHMSRFTSALAHSVSEAVSTAGGHETIYGYCRTTGQRAAKWFIDHYPLLGGLASHFKIIEDQTFCYKNEIQIAAIDAELGELYLNPSAPLNEEEWKFVLAHEYLHAGLMHHERCNGRDHYLWNVACDFVINGWLHELGVGIMPKDGLLYDPSLAGLSAESIYDLILANMKKFAKLNTFRGYHKGDIFGGFNNSKRDHTTLDDFCRNAMQQGLDYHISTGRGFVPAGLIEEIRSLSMPPIPWDVALAKWFDIYFAPLERHRSYARPSRRQASTPDIPRPRYTPAEISVDSRTFGVVIDTSGSMEAKTIGKALGTIASYSVAHDVPFARVVFCDAAAYDIGYVSPEDIAGRVAVKGRGGTVLQPGINTLENTKDFPKDGPILIITDGEIEDELIVKHEHAYLLPKGKHLPFRTKSEVFYFEE